MTLDRRDFSISLIGATLIATAARAQPGAPVEGVNYIRLEQPLAGAVPGQIEVVDFFWYECPHCHAFEPALEAWSKLLPGDVVVRRVPVWFREEPFAAQQKLYYTIEALGLVATLHRRVFQAIHADRTRLRTPEDFAAFALKNGVDPIKFMTTYNSFAVQTRAQQSRELARGYKIDAVPAMGVNGRYYTNGTLANANAPADTPRGSNERMLVVVDALIARSRRGA